MSYSRYEYASTQAPLVEEADVLVVDSRSLGSERSPLLTHTEGRNVPEEVLFKTEETLTRAAIAEALRTAADQIETGSITLEDADGTQTATIPESPTFERELERLTDSETGEQRFELEYEVRWTE